MRKIIYLFAILSLIVSPILTFNSSVVRAKTKKATGTHMLLVICPEEYWKSVGDIAYRTAKKLINQGAQFGMPFLESNKNPPDDEFSAVFKSNYKKGTKLFKKQKIKKAKNLLLKAVEGFNNLKKKYGLSYKVRRRLALSYLYLGASQLLDAQIDQAKLSFRHANSIFPNYPLPKSAFSNQTAMQLYTSAIQRPGKGTGTLIISSTIPGFVFLNGNIVGVAPLTINKVDAGTHVVTFARMGYKPLMTSVIIPAHQKGVANFIPKKVSLFRKTKGKLKKIEASLRISKNIPKALNEISTKIRIPNVLLFRAGANDTEISWYNREINKWQKRVRRQNFVPGSVNDNVIGILFKPKPVIDLGVVVSTGGKCYSDADCPDGKCMNSNCIPTSPVYKRWWFWTAIGVGAAVLGTGTFLILQLQNRPAFDITSP
jgi:PEGA domain